MKKILFSNYYEADTENDIRQFLFDEDTEEGWETPEDIPIERVMSKKYSQDEFEFDWLKYELNRFIQKNGVFLLQGDIGTWRGAMRGGFIFDTFNELTKAWEDCRDIEIYDEDGHLHIRCSHHDGTNRYEVKELTKKGIEYIERHLYDDKETVHTKVFNSNSLSKLPRFADKIFC